MSRQQDISFKIIIINLNTTNLAMIKEVAMFDFEMRMRKLISDLLQPSIDKMANEKEAGANLVRTAQDLVVRMS